MENVNQGFGPNKLFFWNLLEMYRGGVALTRRDTASAGAFNTLDCLKWILHLV